MSRSTPLKNMDAELYRNAAREVAEVMFSSLEHKCCCTAIDDASQDNEHSQKMRKRFALMFAPDGAGLYTEWWGESSMPEHRPERVLALCFMAAMVEAGDA